MWSGFLLILFVITRTASFVNVAHDQSLTCKASMGANPQKPAWSAGKAVDGITSQSYALDSCAITEVYKNRNRTIWWKVWLQRPFNIAYLEIYFRYDTYKRSTGFSIYTYDQENFDPANDPKHFVYHHDPLSGCPSPTMNVTVNYVSQGILFINKRPPEYISNCPGDVLAYTGIELCEVKVLGCEQYRYSPQCNLNCTTRCVQQHCDVFNGSCKYRCSHPNALPPDCIVCKPNYYGSNCNTLCGQCRGDDVCNSVTGHCPHGCKQHWAEPKCDVCKDGFYNSSCMDKCGHCVNGEACDKHTGQCNNGCQPHFQSPFCKVCAPHHYGLDCNTPCGQCRGDVMCDNVTGHCLHGCKPHWNGTRCDVCKDGFYNSSCMDKCGHCLNGDACDKHTGQCINGCQHHFQSPFCKVCSPHYYDQDCNTSCGQCRGHDVCDNVTGQCPHGCKPHWASPRCDVCADHFFNSSCTAKCGNCLNKETCDRRNGTCIKGCQPHFLYPLCTECKDGYFGANCSKKCGHCEDNMPCDKPFGYCLRGCKQNFKPPLCNECAVGFHGKDCQFRCDYCNQSSPGCRQSDGHCLHGCESNLHIDKCKVETPEFVEKREASTCEDGSSNIAFYAVIACLVIIQAITVSIMIYQRRRMSDMLPTKHPTEDIKSQRQITTTNYDNLAFAEESHEYVSIDSTTRD